MKEELILTIKAEDRPGLLCKIIGILNRKQLILQSLSIAKTDINTVVLITTELLSAEPLIRNLCLRIENIVEVIAVVIDRKDQLICNRVAFLKLSKEILTSPQSAAIQKYGANIINVDTDSILVIKAGCDSDILNLYNRLDGKHLLGFAQSGAITNSLLLYTDEYRVIDQAA